MAKALSPPPPFAGVKLHLRPPRLPVISDRSLRLTCQGKHNPGLAIASLNKRAVIKSDEKGDLALGPLRQPDGLCHPVLPAGS